MANLMVILSILSLVSLAKCARILAVFPMPSLSHQIVFRPITQELVKRGHEVVVITADPAFPEGKGPANLTEIDVHDAGYKAWVEAITKEGAGKRNDIVTQMKALIKSSIIFFPAEMNSQAVKDIIAKKKGEFDLLITELCVRPALGFSHIFKVPLIQVSSFGAVLYNDDVIGALTHPTLYPSAFSRRIYNLSIYEKIYELWSNWRLKSFYLSMEKDEHEMLKTIFGANVPPLSELKKNIHISMLSIYPVWTDNQPVPPSVVYMGGIHQKPAKPLPTELQSYLDSSKNGVIYVSFGTNAMPSTFDPETLKAFFDVLSELPYDVLLKWDQDQLPHTHKNIRISKWFPQSDLLRHPKVKLFITQGGLQSTEEAITAGVPLIGIPILGDQWYNCEKYAHHKIGMKLEWDDFQADTFRNAIKTVINNKSYRDNIIKLARIINDQPQTPLERAIWWIEYVIRHGGAKHLRPPTANMSLYDYLEMDLVITVAAVLVTTMLLLSILTYITWTYYIKIYFIQHEKSKSS